METKIYYLCHQTPSGMILFPNAKLNLGLYVTGKRPDGYHDLETIFLPVDLRDALEVIPCTQNAERPKTQFFASGTPVPGNPDQNLVLKAYRLLDRIFDLPPVDIYLHKVIPTEAGLGGGSSDGAFMLKLLNNLFSLGLQEQDLLALAAELGSDCAFFIQNRPSMGSGRGDQLLSFEFPEHHLYPVIVKPGVSLSTAEAFRGIVPGKPFMPIQEAILQPVKKWKSCLFNDFEKAAFKKFPVIEDIKNRLYEEGALYASMSGSGSSVFGLFSDPLRPDALFPDCFVWQSKTPHW